MVVPLEAIWWFPSMVIPPNGRFRRENPTKIDDLEVPPVQENTISRWGKETCGHRVDMINHFFKYWQGVKRTAANDER